MSNVSKLRTKSVEIELDKIRNMRFDLNAFAALEEAYGSIEEALNAMEKGSIKAVRAILWAGLVGEDPTLTINQVGSMIDMESLEMVMTKIADLMSKSIPDAKQTEGK